MSEKKVLQFIPAEAETFRGKDGNPVKKWVIGWGDGTSNPTYSAQMVEALRSHIGKEIEVEFGDKGKIVSAPGIYEGGKKDWTGGGGKSYTPRSIESFFAEEAAKHASFAVSYVLEHLKPKPEELEAQVGLVFGLIQNYHQDSYATAKERFKSDEGAAAPASPDRSEPSAGSPASPSATPTDLKLAAVTALNSAIQRDMAAARDKKDELFKQWTAWDLGGLTDDQFRQFIAAMAEIA